MADLTFDPRPHAMEPSQDQSLTRSHPDPSTSAPEAGASRRRTRNNRHACSVCGRDVPARETVRLPLIVC